ncbi:MAG: hypothetical protein KO253_06160 [Methanobrevibacter arboriphilus]|nr:hypothetical protein [Methanobrevibacter arboriphilus]
MLFLFRFFRRILLLSQYKYYIDVYYVENVNLVMERSDEKIDILLDEVSNSRVSHVIGQLYDVELSSEEICKIL